MASSEHLDLLLKEAEQQVADFGDDSAEIIQHLRDLGYLSQLPFNMINKESTYQKALEKFEHDLIHSKLFSDKEINALRALYSEDFAGEMLRKLMDLDEGVTLKKLPEIGEFSLSSRILHYRLMMYGLNSFDTPRPFGFASMNAMQTLKHYLALKNGMDAVNALANKEEVLKRILSIYGKERCLMFIHISQTAFSTLNFDPKKLRSSKVFYHHLSSDFDFKPRYLAGFKRDILARKAEDVKWEYVKGRSTDEFTNFIIKVVQVHQWMDGFYDGKTDGEIGSVSLNSIADLLKFYNAASKNELNLDSVLYYIGDGFFVFNALSLINTYVIEKVPETMDEELIKKLTIQSGRLKESEKRIFEDNLSKVLSSAKIELSQDQHKQKMGVGKRIYFGIRSFLKKLFRIGKRLVKTILHHLKKIFNQLKDFFKRVLEYGKRALKSFIQGIKYIIGRLPIVSEFDRKVALSHSEFMGDTLSIFDHELSLDGIHQHKKKVQEVQRSSQFSVAIVGEVLKLLKFMVKGFVGWPILILQLAKATRVLVQKHQLIYQQ